MRKKISTLLLIAVAFTSLSCILPEKCIFLYVKGTRWRARVVGQGLNLSGLASSVEGSAVQCLEKDDNALFTAADLNNPLYIALRDTMVADARLECVKQAQKKNLHDIECDPANEEDNAIVIIEPIGSCDTSDLNLIKGDPDYCLTAGMDSGATDASTTTQGDTQASTTLEGATEAPTTTDGDTETPPTTEGDTERGLGDLDTMIRCKGTGCFISQDLIDAALDNPRLLLDESTRLVQRTDTRGRAVGMAFTGVSINGLADKLGFADGDLILDIEGLPFIDESDFLAVALEIYEASEVTMTVDRGGSTRELTFIRD